MTAEPAPKGFDYGASLYSAAWPLLSHPINGFQMGLAGTWILPQNSHYGQPLVPHGTLARDTMKDRRPNYWTVFQTIEGGLGFWASNKFFSKTAKFRMNGTPDGYNHEISTPGWEFSGKALPGRLMGLAQLSNRILIPPDGVTLSKQTLSELFGYAWMALPLVPAQNHPVKTGDQCWTSFFNTENFRGPVAFYLPINWTRMSEHYPPAVGRGLDARPGYAASGAIEVNTVPQFASTDNGGARFTRIPSLHFPVNNVNQTVLLNDLTVYSKGALWDQVLAWRHGGKVPSGTFLKDGSWVLKVKANPIQLKVDGKKAVGIHNWVQTSNIGPHTFGLVWQDQAISAWKGPWRKGTFPHFFKVGQNQAVAMTSQQIPFSSGLASTHFPLPNMNKSDLPSNGGFGVWKHPGRAAGPFKVTLSGHSVVTYYWYLFINQPSMQHSGLSPSELQKLQKLVDQIQIHWTQDKQYMAPPSRGTLAGIDPALLVKPPNGLEVGYVPIAIQQVPAK